MKTKEQIESLMLKLKNWDMLKDLSQTDIESIEQDLKRIAGTAVMDANNKIQNILPDFYTELTK